MSALLPHMHGLCILAMESGISKMPSITEFQETLRLLSTNLEAALSQVQTQQVPLSISQSSILRPSNNHSLPTTPVAAQSSSI